MWNIIAIIALVYCAIRLTMPNVTSLMDKICACFIMFLILVVGILSRIVQLGFELVENAIHVKTLVPELIEIAIIKNLSDAMKYLRKV